MDYSIVSSIVSTASIVSSGLQQHVEWHSIYAGHVMPVQTPVLMCVGRELLERITEHHSAVSFVDAQGDTSQASHARFPESVEKPLDSPSGFSRTQRKQNSHNRSEQLKPLNSNFRIHSHPNRELLISTNFSNLENGELHPLPDC